MGGSNAQNPGFQLAPSAGGSVYPQGLFPKPSPTATPAPSATPAMQQSPTVPTGPAIYDTDGSLVILTPEQLALRENDLRKVQQQDAAFAANQSRYLKQREGQQNEAFATAFANKAAGFSLPKTQPKLDSNRYVREASQPATQDNTQK